MLEENYTKCNLCPRKCGVNRKENKKGVCKAERDVKIASYNLHFGEEPPISGTKGSGTIFFSGCTMRCVFCQNFPISHLYNGKYYSIEELSNILLYLQKRGAHNINLVSPTPYLYHFVKAFEIAKKKGFSLPIVYNTSGYERVDIIRELRGIIDIYLPDFKYSSNEIAKKYSGVKDYVQNALSSIYEMYKQVGILETDKRGIAKKGIIIRHLILPNNVKNSIEVLNILKDKGLNNVHISLMSQFFPAHLSSKFKEISRKLNIKEYEAVKEHALNLGFTKGWFQDI